MNKKKAPLCKGSCQPSCLQLDATEGLFHEVIDIFANTPKILMYFRIRYSDNGQTVLFKKSGSFFVVLLSFFGIMPRAVKLYDEICLCAVKIRNIPSENLLTRKANGIGAQKIIPKVFFFFCHILSQHFGSWNNIFIMLSLHYNPSVTLSCTQLIAVPPPFTQGRLLICANTYS